MELIKVSSEKLKIILTKNDMDLLEITCDSLDYGSLSTRRAIWQILDTAKDETGFDADGDKLYIQAFPSADGGCEMFFTKHSSLLTEPPGEKSLYLKKKYIFAEAERRYIAESENLEDIIKLAVRMKRGKFKGRSSLLFYKDKYYLSADFSGRKNGFLRNGRADCGNGEAFSFMCEYADVYSGEELASAYIDEYAETIIKKQAVETLAEKFGER